MSSHSIDERKHQQSRLDKKKECSDLALRCPKTAPRASVARD